MRLTILSVVLQFLLSSATWAQETKTAWQNAKKKSVAEKIFANFLVPANHSLSQDYAVYGILDAPEAFKEPNERKIRIVNLATVNEFAGIPFPGKAARSLSSIAVPEWIPGLLNANFITDITDSDYAVFYGVDTTGISAYSLPYLHIDSLLSAYLRHDLIYFSGTEASLTEWFGALKLKSKEKRLVTEKYLQRSAQPSPSGSNYKPANSYQHFKEWAIAVYATNNALQQLQEQVAASHNTILYLPEQQPISAFLTVFEWHSAVKVHRAYDTAADPEFLKEADLVIIPYQHPGLTPEKLPEVTQSVFIQFGANTAPDLAGNAKVIVVPDTNDLSKAVTAQVLNGIFDKNGRAGGLYFGLPHVYANFDTTQFAQIDSIVHRAIKDQVLPGCQILVAKDNAVVSYKSYGYFTYDSLRPVSYETRYDLASLTKPLATTLAIMRLVEQNKISLDAPLSDYLPYLKNTNKDSITTRQVLAHQAGLYPYFPFWKKAIAELKVNEMHGSVQAGSALFVEPFVADSLTGWAAKSDLLAERIDTITHAQYMYSDVGFYFLQDLIEKTTHQSLDQYLYANFYQDLGTGLRFTPLNFYPKESIAPTEFDVALRNELVQGFVHDRNAALKGGIAGHSGLFGNARDVAIMLQLQLNKGWYAGKRYYSEELANEFTTRHFANNRRGLGWDMPGPEPDGPVSTLASATSFGHTGFTGVSIWADPQENLIFVFLSNRVYPDAENNKLVEENIRTRIQDIIYKSILTK